MRERGGPGLRWPCHDVERLVGDLGQDGNMTGGLPEAPLSASPACIRATFQRTSNTTASMKPSKRILPFSWGRILAFSS